MDSGNEVINGSAPWRSCRPSGTGAWPCSPGFSRAGGSRTRFCFVQPTQLLVVPSHILPRGLQPGCATRSHHGRVGAALQRVPLPPRSS